MMKIMAYWENGLEGSPVTIRLDGPNASFKELGVFVAYLMAWISISQKARDFYAEKYDLDKIMKRLVRMAKYIVEKEQEKDGGNEHEQTTD